MDQSDLQNYNKFLNMVNKGDFDLKGEAIMTAAMSMKWFYELGPKLKQAIKTKEEYTAMAMEKMEESVKPIDSESAE